MKQTILLILLLLSLCCGSVVAQTVDEAKSRLFVKMGVAGNVLARPDAVQDAHYDDLSGYMYTAYDVWIHNNSTVQSVNAALAELDRLMGLVTYEPGGGDGWPYRPAIHFDLDGFPAHLYNCLAPVAYPVLGMQIGVYICVLTFRKFRQGVR